MGAKAWLKTLSDASAEANHRIPPHPASNGKTHKKRSVRKRTQAKPLVPHDKSSIWGIWSPEDLSGHRKFAPPPPQEIPASDEPDLNRVRGIVTGGRWPAARVDSTELPEFERGLLP